MGNHELNIPFGSYLTAGVPAVVMVSGGGDSVALLHLLVAAGYADSLSVVHVNHGLRGADSDADESYVRALCSSLNVDCTVATRDVGAYAAEAGLNVEEAGRQVRYAVAEARLDALCAAAGIDPARGRIVTAHTRDDRVETFLARLASGAGPGGLTSIPRRRGRIVRPLLDIDRASLRAYLTAHGVSWCEDATNADTARERAFVRHELLPKFESLNPRFAESLARTMDLLADDDALLQSLAAGFARDFSDDAVPGEYVTLNLSFMRTLDPTMARRVVRTAVLDTFPDASRLEAAHIQRLADALSSERFSSDLPGGLRAETVGRALRIERVARDERGAVIGSAAAPCSACSLGFDGTYDLGSGGTLAIGLHKVDGDPVEWVRHRLSAASVPERTALLDAGLLLGSLAVGPAREGERLTPLGLGGSKKISDMLVDAKVPRDMRVTVPVVRDGRNVIWVAGLAIADPYRVTESTTQVLQLTWEPARERSGK